LNIEGEYLKNQPLLKLLMSTGFGSRRYIANLIKQEKITINGEKVVDFTFPVNVERDSIQIDNKPIVLKQKQKLVLMLNKPAGIISTTSDEKGRKTVLDILPAKYRNMMLYPVGRLDKNTTGLLLLSNDGEMTYHLTHPKFEHEKEYLVLITRKLNVTELQRIKNGVLLDDGITYPGKIKVYNAHRQPFVYSVTIHEGRKRQIHRMFEQFERNIIALKRIRIGDIELGNLREGEVRQLSKPEINKLFKNPK